MAAYISTKTAQGTYVHHLVPDEVYLYVRQLEAYIRHPGESKLLEAYPHLTPRPVPRGPVEGGEWPTDYTGGTG